MLCPFLLYSKVNPIWIPFISFSALIAVAKSSKTMLNSNGESGHPCLVPRFMKDNLVESVFQGVTFRKHAFTSSKMAHTCGENLVILCVV